MLKFLKEEMEKEQSFNNRSIENIFLFCSRRNSQDYIDNINQCFNEKLISEPKADAVPFFAAQTKHSNTDSSETNLLENRVNSSHNKQVIEQSSRDSSNERKRWALD